MGPLPPPPEHNLCLGQGTCANGLESSNSIILILDAEEAIFLSACSDWLRHFWYQILFGTKRFLVPIFMDKAVQCGFLRTKRNFRDKCPARHTRLANAPGILQSLWLCTL